MERSCYAQSVSFTGADDGRLMGGVNVSSVRRVALGTWLESSVGRPIEGMLLVYFFKSRIAALSSSLVVDAGKLAISSRLGERIFPSSPSFI